VSAPLVIGALLLCGLMAVFVGRWLTSGRIDLRQTRTCVLLLVALGIVAYVNSFQNGFVWDDRPLIVERSSVRNWNDWPRAFTQDLYDSPVTQSFYYRPLQHLSYRLDYSLWGLNAAGYHLWNILLHTGNGILVFLLVRRFSRNAPLALACAALYVVHPVHTQAVTYIAGRADPLCGSFLLLTLLFYANAKDSPGARSFGWLGLATVCYAAALCSKEFAVVFPALLLVFELCLPNGEGRRGLGRAVARLAPFLVLVVVMLFVRKTIFGAVNPSDPIADTGLSRWILCFRALAAYFGLLIAPFDLHMERTVVTAGWKGTFLTVLGVASALGLLAGVIHYWKRNRTIAFAVLWFLVFFLPVSNLWPLHSTVAEHWVYFASIGWLWAACAIVQDRLATGSLPAARASRLGAAIVLLFILAFTARTILRNRDWQDEVTFFRKTIAASGGSSRLFNNLGKALEREGKLAEAEKVFLEGLSRDPGYDPLLNNLGLLHARQGRKEKALALFQQALTNKPWRVEAYVNLAETWGSLGRTNEASQVFHDAKERFPQSALVAFHSGLFAFRQRDFGTAAAEFLRGHQIDPQAVEFANALGSVAVEQNRPEDAVAWLQKAKALDRLSTNPHVNLAMLYQRQEKFGDAERELRQGLRVAPQNPELHYRLGVLYWRMGRTDEAKRALREALRLFPDFTTAQETLRNIEAGFPYDSAPRVLIDIPMSRTSVSSTAPLR